MKTLKLIFFICFVISCSAQKPNLSRSNLVGTWSCKEKVTVRYKIGFLKYQFVTAPDSVEVNFSIDENGKFSGTVGNSKFKNCVVKKNRGAIGRKINRFTDYVVRGKLEGKIFSDDISKQKFISFPFNLTDKKLSGSVFHLKGFDLYPMFGINASKQKN